MEQRALAEHLYLLQVYSLLVELSHFLKIFAVDDANYRIVLFGFSDKCSFPAVDELRLAKAFALLEGINLLILKLYLLAEVGKRDRLMRFLEDGQAERHMALDDHVDGGCVFPLVVDDIPFAKSD